MRAALRLHAALGLVVWISGCRHPDPIEPPAPTPEPPSANVDVAPPPIKLVALALSASGGCALDSVGELWCWGGYATRHHGLRGSVGEDEFLVATRVETGGRVRDFDVTEQGVCWLGDGGIVRCHLAEGVESYDLGDAISFEATTDDLGDHVVVVELDHQTLHSNLWPEPRQYGSIVDYDLAGPKLCVQLEDRKIACDEVRTEQPARGDSFGNAFTRTFSAGPSTVCVIEDSGVVECLPRFDSMSSNIPSRWIEGISDAIAIDVGDHHACALRAGGAVTCFGGNGYFQRGEGNEGVANVELPGPATAIAAAGMQSCAIVDDEILCWGAPATGPVDRWIARNDIALESTALHVSAHFNCVSRSQTATIRVDDTPRQSHVWCWGTPNASAIGSAAAGISAAAEPRAIALPMPDIDHLIGRCFRRGERTACGSFSELGILEAGVATEHFLVRSELPARMATFAGFADETPIYCGAIRSGSRLQCTDDSYSRHLNPASDAPTSGPWVLGPEGLGCTFTRNSVTCFHALYEHWKPARNNSFEGIRSLAAGEIGWFALDEAGRVWMFTVGPHGVEESQLAIGNPTLVPIGDAIEIGAFAGDLELCVRDAGGAIRCSTRVDQGWSDARVELDHGALELDVGFAHACARVDVDGDKTSESLHCWGDNRFAQLGTVGVHAVNTPTVIRRR